MLTVYSVGWFFCSSGVDWSYNDHDVLLTWDCQDGLHTEFEFDAALPVGAINWNILFSMWSLM